MSSLFDIVTIGVAGREYFRMTKAQAGAAESQKGLETMTGDESGELRQRVSDLKRAGIISDREARGYERQLKAGGFDNVSSVLNATNRYMKNGTAEDQQKSRDDLKEKNRLDEEHRQLVQRYQREESSVLNEMHVAEIQRYNLMDSMAYLDRNSIEYKRKQLELDQLDHTVVEKKRLAAEKHLELEKKRKDIYREAEANYERGDQIDVESPTIEMLAGRKYVKNLNKLYGEGGQYDLEKGDGPFANPAQQALLWKNRQMWDIVHGNATWGRGPDGKPVLTGGQAYIDKLNRMQNENLLAAAGIETPAMQFHQLNVEMADLNVKMGQLLDAAKREGIVIKGTE